MAQASSEPPTFRTRDESHNLYTMGPSAVKMWRSLAHGWLNRELKHSGSVGSQIGFVHVGLKVAILALCNAIGEVSCYGSYTDIQGGSKKQDTC